LLDPEAILFGGGTSDAGEALLERIRRRVPPRLLLRARLLLAGLGSDSQLYGALWGAAKAANLPTPDARRATSANRSSEAQERAARLGGSLASHDGLKAHDYFAGMARRKLDLEPPISDGLRLSDELIEPLLNDRAVAVVVDVNSATRGVTWSSRPRR
jgi:hypothetical protein